MMLFPWQNPVILKSYWNHEKKTVYKSYSIIWLQTDKGRETAFLVVESEDE
jgi:hypothetical protein